MMMQKNKITFLVIHFFSIVLVGSFGALLALHYYWPAVVVGIGGSVLLGLRDNFLLSHNEVMK